MLNFKKVFIVLLDNGLILLILFNIFTAESSFRVHGTILVTVDSKDCLHFLSFS